MLAGWDGSGLVSLPVGSKNLDIPRASRGGAAHGGAAHGEAAGRGGTGQSRVGRDAGRSVRPGNNYSSCRPANRKQPSWTYIRKHEQTKSDVNRIPGSVLHEKVLQ